MLLEHGFLGVGRLEIIDDEVCVGLVVDQDFPLVLLGLVSDFGVVLTDLNACFIDCLLYTSPSPRDQRGSRMPSSA